MHRGMAGVCVLAALAAVGAVLLAGAAGPVGAAEASDNGTEPAGNASLGAEISSFMQASSAEAERDVEDGRFDAAMNRTDDEAARRALIADRLASLEARQEQLRTRRDALGATPDVRNRSIATRVAVGASELERSLERTERATAEVGVDDERLAELRSNASTMTGPEVAELARGLAGPPGDVGGPPEGNRTGAPGTRPPSETRGPDNRTGGGNASASSVADRSDTAPPANGRGVSPNGNASTPEPDAGDGQPDAGSEDGPSDSAPGGTPDASSEDGSGNGPPDDAGDGESADPPDAGPSDDSPGPPDDASGDGSSDDASDQSGTDPGPRSAESESDDSDPSGPNGGQGAPTGGDDTDGSESGAPGGPPPD